MGDVAEHLRFAAVCGEDGVGHEGGGALEGPKGVRVVGLGGVEELVGVEGEGVAEVEGCDEVLEECAVGGFVEGDADGAVVVGAEVDAAFVGGVVDLVGLCGAALAEADSDGVEDGSGVEDLVAHCCQGFSECDGVGLDALCDSGEAFGPVVDAVEGGHDGEEGLGGADVASGLVAFDVLFAGLDCHAEGGVALGVLGDTDDAAWEFAGVFFVGGDEGGVWAAEPHGDAEALGRSDGDVGAPLAGWLEEGEREGVARGDEHGALGVGGLGEVGEVVDDAVGVGVLDEDAADVAGVHGECGRGVGDDELCAEALGAGFEDADGLGVAVGGGDEDGFLVLGDGEAHPHGFGGGGALVEEACAGEGEAGQVGEHGLEVEEGFESALGDLGLVWGVLGVPAGVFEDIAEDDRGGDGAVVAHADAGSEDLVAAGGDSELLEELVLAAGGADVQGVLALDGVGDGGVGEGVEGVVAEGLEHRCDLGVAWADVAAREVVGEVEARVGVGRGELAGEDGVVGEGGAGLGHGSWSVSAVGVGCGADGGP